MALGDNRYQDSATLLTAGFTAQSVQVTITPSEASLNVPRDKYMRPISPTTTTQISIVISKAENKIKQTEAGGKPVEALEFYALPDTINENDELTWNGHTYRTTAVWPFGLGGLTQLVSCEAEREVDA